MSNEDRIYDRQLTRHLDTKFGDPVPEEESDLVADERSQLILDAIDGKDVARVGRLISGAKK